MRLRQLFLEVMKMTAVDNTFETLSAALNLTKPNHFDRGFACPMDTVPQLPQKCNPHSWVKGAMRFWALLALKDCHSARGVFFAAIPDMAIDVRNWASQVAEFSGGTAKVETIGDVSNRVQLSWEKDGKIVRLDVWDSQFDERLQAYLFWDTGTGEASKTFFDAGLDQLMWLAEVRDMLFESEE